MNLPQVKSILSFYKSLAKSDDYEWVRWSDNRRRFSKHAANELFVGIMLDQGQLAERAWAGGTHLVENYFNESDNFWKEILDTHTATIKKICQKGFDGKSYATNFSFNRFPKHLRAAAKLIVEKYDSDVRNIWNVTPRNVIAIYDRFVEFDGIGDALAKMAQFILVRNYGVAGGKNNQEQMSIKPDILVRRVLYRSGLTRTEKTADAVSIIENLKLKSPADFDAAAWIVGREYCSKSDPFCGVCPINSTCMYPGITD